MKYIASYIFYCMLSITCYAMDSMQPYSENPIEKFPRYMYENCNHMIRHVWKDDEYEDILKFAKKDPTIIENMDDTKRQEIELHNWICALQNIEQLGFLKKGFDTYIKIGLIKLLPLFNRPLAKFLDEEPGVFRKVPICWQQSDISVALQVVGVLLGEWVSVEDLTSYPFGFNSISGQFKLDELARFIDELREQELQVRVLLGEEYTLDDFQAQNCTYPWGLQAYTVEDIQSLKGQDIQDLKNSYGDTITYEELLKKCIHIFPDPSLFTQELITLSSLIQDTSIHAVRRAALVWYHIVRIHLWHEANKRTGSLVGAVILLRNGYLPPLIEGDNGERYVEILMDCLTENNPEPFVEFISELVETTQQSVRQGFISL